MSLADDPEKAARFDVGRRLSNVESEVGHLRRDAERMERQCRDDIVGTQDRPGLVLQMDRIRRDRERDVATLKWIVGPSLFGTLAAVGAALKAWGIL